MEENLDSIKDIVNKKYDPEEKLSRIENSEKNSEDTNKLNVEEKDLEQNNKNNSETGSEINNDKKISLINKASTEANKIEAINQENQKISNSEIKKIKLNEGSESANTLQTKQKKEIPIEKKPFNEFVNSHLLPSLINEFKGRGFEVNNINLQNTSRPIAGDKCWVIYCEIKDICNFWLSFEKDDISSLKSISLSKFNQKPSVIESFLIDEKRITQQLIISRILQRLNGQKLIGDN